MQFRPWLLFSLLLGGLSACGMAEDEQEDHKRNTFPLEVNPPFEKVLLPYYDLNKDGRISRYEAERVLRIDCSGEGLTSLYGIEHFVQLQELQCADNPIDLLDLSLNKQLRWVDCSKNELTALYVAPLRSLEWLDCHDNHLSILDLKGTSSLEVLDAFGNELQLLDASTCARHMVRLDLSQNPIETLYLHEQQRVDDLQSGGAEVLLRE